MTNTTPLITLAGVVLLDLLPLLYGKVWAPRIGLPVAGTLAVLLRAKQQGFITAIQPYIAQMQSQGRRFHPDLIVRLLEDAGE